ncbi:MAG: helix-turn-helix domain-containing protein [Sphingopyxis sp.]
MTVKPIAVTTKDGFGMIPVSVAQGYRLIAAGELEAFKVGRATRITVASIEAYVARRLAETQKLAA